MSRPFITPPYNLVHEQRSDIEPVASTQATAESQWSTTPEEVSTMAKKDDGHKEIKKGKESER